MDTIIERDSGVSAVILFLGVLAIAVLAGLGLYFLRIYPFETTQQPVTNIDVNLPAGTQPAAPKN